MLTLLGSFLGFLGSLVPEFFRNFQDRRDKSHELEILKMQMQLQQQGVSERLDEINARADIAQANNIYKTFYSGHKDADRLNAIVRPVIALGFFGLYCLLKLLAFYHLPQAGGAPFIVIYGALWTDEDAAIFAGIISFYFGNRALNKRAR